MMRYAGKVLWAGAFLSLTLMAGAGDAQTRAELARTVNLLRYNWPATTYVNEWTGYMGFTSLTAREKSDGAAALTAINDQFTASRADLMLSALETYLVSDPPDELTSMAIYYYFNRVVDLEGAIPAPTAFDAALPAWALLGGPSSKFFYSYICIDLAWQARAEGNAAYEEAYFTRVRATAKRLMDEEPGDPVQVWNVYNYILASAALGEESTADALTDLKARVASTEPCVLTWIARFQLGTVPFSHPTIPNETEDHLGVIADQANADFMLAAYSSPHVMRDVKAMLRLDSVGVMQLRGGEKEAVLAAYDSVVTDYGAREEWTPRRTGRTIVNPSEYGVVSMTEHNRLSEEIRGLRDDPTAYVAALDRFLTNFPNSEHADGWLWKKGRYEEFRGDLTRARDAYSELTNDRGYSPHSAEAAERLAVVDAELGQ